MRKCLENSSFKIQCLRKFLTASPVAEKQNPWNALVENTNPKLYSGAPKSETTVVVTQKFSSGAVKLTESWTGLGGNGL